MVPDASERIEWSRPPELPGIEVLRADRCTRIWRVFHQTYTVCAILDISGGETEWAYRGKLHASKAGGLMLMEPGEIHAMPHVIPPCDFRVVLIDPSLAGKAAIELGFATAQPHLKLAHFTDPGLFGAFVQFHAALQGVSSILERESRLANCIRLLFRDCTETGARVPKQPARCVLLRVRDLIREHYSRPITLADLAAVTGLSRYHLGRAFAKEFGLPPHAYQIRVQAAHACRLLTENVAPAQIAAEVGFADQSHFTKHFRRIYGVTPGRYQSGSRGLA